MKLPIRPMEPGAIRESFSHRRYAFEVDYPGHRTIAYLSDNNVRLFSNSKDVTGKYTEIAAAFQRFGFSAIIDGVITALNDEGLPDLQALSRWRPNSDVPLYYFAFDLLLYNDTDYMSKPLYSRKSTLKNILPRSPVVLYHSEMMTYGEPLYRWASARGMGIIAKKIDSVYTQGRSKDWVSVPVKAEVGIKRKTPR